MAKLLRFAAPPPRRTAPPRKWALAEETLGTRLPADYKAFLNHYGSGVLAGFIRVWNPFPDPAEWLWAINQNLEADREARENCPEEYTGPIFPEPGGRLPWGSTLNGDVLWWLTHGDADAWTVVVWESRGPGHEAFPMPTVEFLWKWASGKLTVSVCSNPTLRKGDRRFGADPRSRSR